MWISPWASNGQQYPLPCCAHFRFQKCVSLCLCFYLFFCVRLSRNLLFERHLFLFSSNSKSMHVYMHACVHLCLCVSEVRGGASLYYTIDLMENSATLHTTMVCTAWKDHISRLCTEIIKIVKSATAVTDKGHSFMKVKPQIPCIVDFCSKGTRQKRNPLTSSPNDFFCIYWL